MSEITKEQNVLLHLLQKSFHPDTAVLPEEVLNTVDWSGVFKEAVQQAVLITAFDAAAVYKSYIPGEVYMQTFQQVSRGMMKNLRVSAAQKALVALLETGGYPYVILKGEAAAAYYPKPELRHLGDVDFLIDPARKEEIDSMLTAAGYTGSMHEHICHVVYKKPGAHLEMHFEIAGIPYGKPGEQVRAYMADALHNAQVTSVGGSAFAVPAEVHQGMILLLHMSHHMVAEGLGLRHLCDWAAFIDRTWEKGFWQDRLLPALEEIGLLKYASVMTKICADHLGTACPDWAAADDELCASVLHDILTGGNFGRKDAERSKAGMMISEHGKAGIHSSSLHNLWKTLHRSTGEVYPLVKKVKILHPVLDVYRAGLYLGRRVMGKRPSLLKLAPLAQERRSIYEQLEIFETKE